ncbi:predicted protein [Nematostella vectensis]|uniref:Apple domain-containing protein n=1 Tax=Nematostella vectensis TaxID=45351 RepID=A7RM74_NEMVE|nr:uncharacterized skeletal organic matrix protein 5 [Nematostella vectensis]EDO47455.1 predicted protein [Nematostella vectensis]|eukprot:XP_001639518.1 predicted protein [Nematostella vectensis]
MTQLKHMTSNTIQRIRVFTSLILLAWGSTMTEPGSRSSTFARFPNTAFELDGTILTKGEVSEMECAMMCSAKRRCKVAVYETWTHDCRLGKHSSGPEQTVHGIVTMRKIDLERKTPVIGTPDVFRSCQEILEHGRSVGSGAYNLTTEDSSEDQVFCQMSDNSACGSGGWTLVMIINGDKQTFRYDSDYWTNKKTFHPRRGQLLEMDDTKLPTYWTTSFTRLCLGVRPLKFNSPIEWSHVEFSERQASLYSVITSGLDFIKMGQEWWLNATHANNPLSGKIQEGINVMTYNTSVRLGVVGTVDNWTGSQRRPSSYMGVGTQAWWHQTYGGISCGSAKFENSLKEKSPAFCYLLVK